MANNEYNSTVEVIKLVANSFASIGTTIASFTVIASIVAIVTPKKLVIIQGNTVQVTLPFILLSGAISFLFLAQACFVLLLLRGVDND